MNNSRLTASVFFILGLYLLSACDSNSEGPVRKTGVLIVNEGNFGSGNGSISSYDEDNMTIANNFVKNANNGSEIGSLVQSVYIHEGTGYIVCNSNDKIEFIDADNGKYLANPVSDISQPRYMTVVGDKGYISCWGPWDTSNPNWWKLLDSYIAVIDLSTKSVIDSLSCGSGPEGIVAAGNKLFVANSFETSVSVIDLNDHSSSKVILTSDPKHLVADESGLVWVSTSVGLILIEITSQTVIDNIVVENIQGKLTFDGGSRLYFLTVEPWEPNKVNFRSEVFVLDTGNKTVIGDALITGDDFYGLGYNETTDRIYVSDSKAFSGPGEISIYDIEGRLIDKQVTAVGPNGVAFKD